MNETTEHCFKPGDKVCVKGYESIVFIVRRDLGNKIVLGSETRDTKVCRDYDRHTGEGGYELSYWKGHFSDSADTVHYIVNNGGVLDDGTAFVFPIHLMHADTPKPPKQKKEKTIVPEANLTILAEPQGVKVVEVLERTDAIAPVHSPKEMCSEHEKIGQRNMEEAQEAQETKGTKEAAHTKETGQIEKKPVDVSKVCQARRARQAYKKPRPEPELPELPKIARGDYIWDNDGQRVLVVDPELRSGAHGIRYRIVYNPSHPEGGPENCNQPGPFKESEYVCFNPKPKEGDTFCKGDLVTVKGYGKPVFIVRYSMGNHVVLGGIFPGSNMGVDSEFRDCYKRKGVKRYIPHPVYCGKQQWMCFEGSEVSFNMAKSYLKKICEVDKGGVLLVPVDCLERYCYSHYKHVCRTEVKRIKEKRVWREEVGELSDPESAFDMKWWEFVAGGLGMVGLAVFWFYLGRMFFQGPDNVHGLKDVAMWGLKAGLPLCAVGIRYVFVYILMVIDFFREGLSSFGWFLVLLMVAGGYACYVNILGWTDVPRHKELITGFGYMLSYFSALLSGAVIFIVLCIGGAEGITGWDPDINDISEEEKTLRDYDKVRKS